MSYALVTLSFFSENLKSQASDSLVGQLYAFFKDHLKCHLLHEAFSYAPPSGALTKHTTSHSKSNLLLSLFQHNQWPLANG